MEYLKIIIFIIICWYLIPTVKYVLKRFQFALKLNSSLSECKFKKYGGVLFKPQNKTSFFIETENKIYAVIQFRIFYKYMIFFDKKKSAQVRFIGIRRFIPIKPFYNVNLSEFDFLYGFEKLPISVKNKDIVPILLMNPAPKAITTPSRFIGPDNIEVEIGPGEYIENFYITNTSFFFKNIRFF